jgi:ribose transport system ATP-binding protein
VVIGRALTRDQKIYIFDEPTAGVDVGARQEIYGLMKQLCEQGATVILVSSDLQELLNLSHRVVVMHRGRIQAELTGDDINEAAVVGASFGSAQSGSAVTQQPVTH